MTGKDVLLYITTGLAIIGFLGAFTEVPEAIDSLWTLVSNTAFFNGNSEVTGDSQASSFTLNGTSITDWSAVNQSSGGGSSFVYSDYFDQFLNTSNVPTFEGFNLESEQKLVTAAGIVNIDNNLTNTLLGGIIGITAELYGASWAALIFNPMVYTNSEVQAFRFQPAWASGFNHAGTAFIMNPSVHVPGYNDNLAFYKETGVSRQFFSFSGDSSSVTYPWIDMGGAVTLFDTGVDNVDYTENMITLRGGGTRAAGTNGFIRQRGLIFSGFNTQTNLISGTDYVKAVDSDGGIFEWDAGTNSLFNVSADTLVNLPYISVYNVTDAGYPIIISSLNSFVNITNLSVSESHGFSLSGGSVITNSYAGTYKIDYSLSYENSASSVHYFGILKDGVEHEDCRSYRKMGTTGDLGNVGSSCMIALSAGDELTLAVADYSLPADNIDIWTVNVNIVRVGS